MFARAPLVALLAALLTALQASLQACSPPGPSVKGAVMCRSLTGQGQPVTTVESYNPTDTFHLSLETEHCPPSAKIATTWFFGDRYLCHLREPAVRGGTGHVAFRLPPVDPWGIGDYRAEVFIAGNRMEALAFRVTAPDNAIPSEITSAVITVGPDHQENSMSARPCFAPSDRIKCVVCADMGAYSSLAVRWYANGRLLRFPAQSESVCSNIEGECYEFLIDIDQQLAPGEYQADVYLDQTLRRSLVFWVEDPSRQSPAMGLVAFSQGLDPTGQPIHPSTSFPPGTRSVYAVYEFAGMHDDLLCEESWLLNGKVQASQSHQWQAGARGSRWLSLTSPQALSSGSYELRLSADGDVLRRGHFRIETGDEAGALYRDDFSDPESGWGETTVEAGNSSYGTGIFCITVDQPQWLVWSTAGQEFDDFVLEADAWQASGPADASYGIVARYTDADHFYRFEIGGDQQYSILKSSPQEWVSLVDWAESQAILPNRSINHIKIVCRGTVLSLRVNGEHLVTVTDDSLVRGDIGLIGATFDQGGAVLCFDNVKVSAPDD